MSKIVKILHDGFIKYHGCGIYHRDGSNVLITKDRGCSRPIDACFWMKPEHVHKKVTARTRELNKTIHSNSLLKQYEREQLKSGILNYYSTDDETMLDSDSGSDYDSDDQRLVIDINNAVNSISNTIQTVDRQPDNKNDTDQTADNK